MHGGRAGRIGRDHRGSDLPWPARRRCADEAEKRERRRMLQGASRYTAEPLEKSGRAGCLNLCDASVFRRSLFGARASAAGLSARIGHRTASQHLFRGNGFAAEPSRSRSAFFSLTNRFRIRGIPVSLVVVPLRDRCRSRRIITALRLAHAHFQKPKQKTTNK